MTELRESDFAFAVEVVLQFVDDRPVAEALHAILLDTDLQLIPRIGLVFVAELFPEHVPVVDDRAVETRDAELATRGIEAVVPFAAVGVKHESGRAVLFAES